MPDLCPKSIDLTVKPSASSCPPTLAPYPGLPTEHTESQGTAPTTLTPGRVAFVSVKTQAQAANSITGGNINNLRYPDDTILTAESEEELKSFLMKVKEESEKFGLKLNIQKMKIMASGLIPS